MHEHDVVAGPASPDPKPQIKSIEVNHLSVMAADARQCRNGGAMSDSSAFARPRSDEEVPPLKIGCLVEFGAAFLDKFGLGVGVDRIHQRIKP
jgi:hypothetical protein